MIKIFYGDDRISAKKEIEKFLGGDYEILDGAEINVNDLPSILMGASLFNDERAILVRDITSNKAVFDEIPKYLNTPHKVVFFETKLDKRTVTYKEIKDKVEIKEFKLPESKNFNLVFEIYRTAKRDGKKAISMLGEIKQDEDPVMFAGLLVSQAIKDFSANPNGKKERAILKELAKVDLEMKSSSIEPWLLIESFLMRLKTI